MGRVLIKIYDKNNNEIFFALFLQMVFDTIILFILMKKTK